MVTSDPNRNMTIFKAQKKMLGLYITEVEGSTGHTTLDKIFLNKELKHFNSQCFTVSNYCILNKHQFHYF